MHPVPVGTRVRVIVAEPFDDVQVGSEVIVGVVDNDGTFRGRDPSSGHMGGWIRWNQVESSYDMIGINFLKAQLSAEGARLLLACHGTENLRLKPEVRDRILLGLPDLGELVRDEALRLASNAPRLKTRRPHPKPAPTSRTEREEQEALEALLRDEFIPVDEEA